MAGKTCAFCLIGPPRPAGSSAPSRLSVPVSQANRASLVRITNLGKFGFHGKNPKFGRSAFFLSLVRKARYGAM
jgi:hypothetical protein